MLSIEGCAALKTLDLEKILDSNLNLQKEIQIFFDCMFDFGPLLCISFNMEIFYYRLPQIQKPVKMLEMPSFTKQFCPLWTSSLNLVYEFWLLTS